MSNNYNYKMFVADGCAHCAEAKRKLKDKIDSGQISILDVAHDKKASALATRYGVNAVPTFLVEDTINNTTEVCSLGDDGKKLICNGKELDL